MSHRQNVTDKMSPTKCHRTKCHWTKCHIDKMSHGQNVTQNVMDKMSPDKMSHRQNVTGQNVT